MSATKITISMLLANIPIGERIGNKVFAVRAPQGVAAPWVVVTLVSEPEGQTLAGASGQFVSRVAVAVHAPDASAADEIGELVKACLGNRTNYRVMAIDDPTRLLGTVTTNKAGGDILDFSDDRSIARRSIDFTVRWQ